ncbi:MAG TPA: class I SAM-dependent methyltransferase [Pseudonocardiaceae bacterium]
MVLLDEALARFVAGSATPPDVVQRDLAAATAEAFPDLVGMQVSAEQGALLTLLARVTAARLIIEVGTFTGYSTLCLARGLAPGGRVVACEIDPKPLEIARSHWERAGIADRIDVRLGDAKETLRALPLDEPVDLAFVDADKAGYPDYVTELRRRLSPRGLIVLDNMLWGGKVLDEEQVHSDPDTGALARLGAQLAADEQLVSVLLPLRDGITLVCPRP